MRRCRGGKNQTIHTEEFFNRDCDCLRCVRLKREERQIFENIKTCDYSNEFWNPDWSKCPNCLEGFNIYGELRHKHMWIV